MKNYKRLVYLFAALAILLSNVMCAAAAYSYCMLQWCGQYGGCSAPADTADGNRRCRRNPQGDGT